MFTLAINNSKFKVIEILNINRCLWLKYPQLFGD